MMLNRGKLSPDKIQYCERTCGKPVFQMRARPHACSPCVHARRSRARSNVQGQQDERWTDIVGTVVPRWWPPACGPRFQNTPVKAVNTWKLKDGKGQLSPPVPQVGKWPRPVLAGRSRHEAGASAAGTKNKRPELCAAKNLPPALVLPSPRRRGQHCSPPTGPTSLLPCRP